MRLTLTRHQVPAQRTSDQATAPAPRYRVVATEDRVDLHCTVCTTAIAVAVREDRIAQDAPFFLDAHSPYCLRVSRG